MNHVLATLQRVNKWIAVAAGLLLLSSVLVTVFDVAARPFGLSLGGTDELSGYAMATLFSATSGSSVATAATVASVAMPQADRLGYGPRNSRPYRELRRQLSKVYGDDSKIFPSSSIHAGFEMVASGIGVGLFPKQLGTELIRQGRIREFDPGWKLQPLKFTASYVGEPLNELCVHAAELAQNVAYHCPTV